MTSSAPPIHSQLISARLAWRLAFIAGLVILVLTFLSIRQEPARPCGGLQENYAPIIAFELARNEADLQALFGAADSACRTELIARMDSVNWVDVLVFIPLYAFFMVCFFLGVAPRDAKLAKLGLALSLLAAAGDYAENTCLMNLTPTLDPSSVWLALLPWATGVKWLGLGAAAGVAGLIYLKLRPRAFGMYIVAALICWAALLLTIAAIAVPASFGPQISAAIGASWFVFLLTAGVEMFRSKA